MNTKELKEGLISYLKYGRSLKKGTIYQLRNNNFKDLQPPIFFLSTGRTGTKWFSELLSPNNELLVFHAPVPDLSVQSTQAYNYFSSSKNDQLIHRLIGEIFFAGREEQLRYAYKTNKRYIETNNFITFFAPVIAEILPNSIFIHIYRHPGEFVRSAISRNYFNEKDQTQIRKIVPKNLVWEELTQLEKICNLWNETNLFIESFKKTIPQNRILDFNFNNLSLETVSDLFHKLGINIKSSNIKSKLNKKSNIQKRKLYPNYANWTNEDKKVLQSICQDLSSKYAFKL